MGLIYKITNKVNGKIYIGQTTQSLDHRWKTHLRVSKSKVPHHAIHDAIRKYGKDNFSVEIVEDEISGIELGNREIFWIQHYNSLVPNGYNIRKGGDDSGRKQVYKIDLVTNEILDIYDSATEASEMNNIDLSGLTKVCRQIENRGTYGGFKWCYAENYSKEYLEEIAIHCSRKICQIDQYSGELIKVWGCVQEAVSALNVNKPSLSMCLTGRNKTAGGYCWCYIEDFDKYVAKTRYKQVLQIDKKTKEVVKVWNTVKEAADKYGQTSNIRAVCKGKQNTAYGFIWRYKGDELYE